MANAKSAKRTKTTKSAAARPAATKKKPIRREVWSVVCLILGLFTAIGYFVKDYWLIDGLCLYVFKGLFGWGFLVTPVCFFLASWILYTHHGHPVKGRLVAAALIPLLFGAVVHLFVVEEKFGLDWISIRSLYLGGRNLETGGVLSGVLADMLKQAVSIYGAAPALLIGLFSMIFIACKVSPKKIVSDLKNRERPEYEPVPLPEPEYVNTPATPTKPPRRPRALPASQIYDEEELQGVPMESERRKPAPVSKPTSAPRKKNRMPIDIPMDKENEPDPEEVVPVDDIPDMPSGIPYQPQKNEPIRSPRQRAREEGTLQEERPSVEDDPYIREQTRRAKPVTLKDGSGVLDLNLNDFPDEPPKPVEAPKPDPARTKNAPKEPEVKPADVAAAAEEISRAIEEAEAAPDYRYPPVSLLHAGSAITADGREEIELNRERLETTLHSFGIGASVTEITHGPTVTRYDLELEAGVKLNKLTNLAGDLALALGVVSVRIAPIPDKISTVGVEVPNKIVSTVYLRDIIDSPAFEKASSKLSFAIGKDIAGNCIVGNISKLPHMLIAGTTGSGKSVCMNSLIISLLYKATPDEVRLIMIDPKMVELGIYNGIPHLYIPVVTDPKKAAGSLQWSVVEMMKRYRLFSEVGVRDIKGYNNYLKKHDQPTIPNVVIVIDELADLMMTAAKEVEESICRVAQMGRAAGMHLVIATQRPSADVITGLMKANIPSRIAFAVSSALESRIILDQQGAEKLIGMGDMLYAPLGCGKPLRVQGAFVTDEEREEIIDFIKADSDAQYDDSIMDAIEKAVASKEKDAKGDSSGSEGGSAASGESEGFLDGYDELIPQAVDVILDTKQASVSMLQRRLKLGYSRAARLVDQMEELGVVGPFEGSKPRQLLITREQWQEMSMTGNSAVERLMNDSKDDFSGGSGL